jgi:hypothetical protein
MQLRVLNEHDFARTAKNTEFPGLILVLAEPEFSNYADDLLAILISYQLHIDHQLLMDFLFGNYQVSHLRRTLSHLNDDLKLSPADLTALHNCVSAMLVNTPEHCEVLLRLLSVVVGFLVLLSINQLSRAFGSTMLRSSNS